MKKITTIRVSTVHSTLNILYITESTGFNLVYYESIYYIHTKVAVDLDIEENF